MLKGRPFAVLAQLAREHVGDLAGEEPVAQCHGAYRLDYFVRLTTFVQVSAGPRKKRGKGTVLHRIRGEDKHPQTGRRALY